MQNFFKGKTIIFVAIIAVILIISIAVILKSGVITGNSMNEFAAKINDEVITKEDLYQALVAQNGAQTLDSLIADKIVELELKKNSLQVSDADVETELQATIVEYGGQEAFDQAIASYGYTMDDIRKNIKTSLSASKLIGDQITVSDEEIKAYFEENKQYFDTPEQVKASHILVDTIEIAQEVKQKLAAGGSFAELAKEYSIDDSNKEQGGDLGFFAKGDMVAEFENAAFAMNIGDVSEPVKTEYGYHIIKLDEKKAAKAAVYEEFKDQVKEIIYGEKLPTAFDTWLQEKYTEYKIETNI